MSRILLSFVFVFLFICTREVIKSTLNAKSENECYSCLKDDTVTFNYEKKCQQFFPGLLKKEKSLEKICSNQHSMYGVATCFVTFCLFLWVFRPTK